MKYLPVFIATILIYLQLATTSSAQWSHKEGDPRPQGVPDYKVQPFTQAEWDASNFASQKDVQWFRDAKYGMFIHFGLSTRVNKELSWGTCQTRKAPDLGTGPIPDKTWQSWPNDFKLEKFNAKSWVEIARISGFKYIVVIAKHHEGFHLWDTAQSNFKVANTPFGRDFLKEIADACHAANMPFGIYYSQRDWYHPDYQPVDSTKVTRDGTNWKLHAGETSPLGSRHGKYLDYQNKACEELCTQYGKVDIFWWDAAWWGGMFTAEMWDAENLTRKIRKWQPHILMNNRCSVPGDFDTPEQILGKYQDWRPWESCISLTESWSYSGGKPKPVEHVVRMIVNNACCDGNLLLSWGPMWNGEFAAKEKSRVIEVGAWLKKNGRSIYKTRGGPWKFADWGGSTHNGKSAWLHVVRWQGEKLQLPLIPERQVVAARLLNGPPVAFTQNQDHIELQVPKHLQDKTDTIIELTMNKSLDIIKAIDAGARSRFSDTATYGQVISRRAKVKTSSRSQLDQTGGPAALLAKQPVDDFAFHTRDEKNPWVEIDLGREVSVTGVRILNRQQEWQNRAAGLTLSVSKDGKQWQQVWTAKNVKPIWEFDVTNYVAGAHVLGKKARYIRLETRPSKPSALHLRQVEVFGR